MYSPGWKERPNDDMKRITYEKMNEHTRGWVMEGNYLSVLGDTDSFSMATDVICLYLSTFLPRASVYVSPPASIY